VAAPLSDGYPPSGVGSIPQRTSRTLEARPAMGPADPAPLWLAARGGRASLRIHPPMRRTRKARGALVERGAAVSHVGGNTHRVWLVSWCLARMPVAVGLAASRPYPGSASRAVPPPGRGAVNEESRPHAAGAALVCVRRGGPHPSSCGAWVECARLRAALDMRCLALRVSRSSRRGIRPASRENQGRRNDEATDA
jgi:hypothetical protein